MKSGLKFLFCLALTLGLAFGLRMLEWPCWQDPEYRLGDEMLLATHDAYHWVAGACGFGRAVDHPMAVMLRLMANALDAAPATVAFWFPAVLASLVAGMVFIWTWSMGGLAAGVAAGLIASMAPGFLGRTLLGYYDTDLVTLFFPLLIALGPALWAMRFCLAPSLAAARMGRALGLKKFLKGQRPAPRQAGGDPLARGWLLFLAASGLAAFWTELWHSVFPYLIRYNVLLLAIMGLVMAPGARRPAIFAGALAYALPALAGPAGLIWPLALACARKGEWRRRLLRPWLLLPLGLAALLLFTQGEILDTFSRQIDAYLKNSGDSHSSGGTALIYPSVAQSIIEVQDLAFAALFPYFHPWLEASILGFLGFAILICKKPGALFLLPLAALALLSSRLGGRMVMFGAPIVAIGICLPCFWLISALARRLWKGAGADWLACILLCALLVAPFMDMAAALSQGPILNRRHAQALSQAREITPEGAMLWLWWDWGYAAHYFARRQTIADGARHGGPSLYLPSAVFATDNPRFARQIIRRASSLGDEPGEFFRNLGPEKAQELVNSLRSAGTPLARGKGRQYVIVSFEMLKLGFWISNYGNWNFITRRGESGALSIVPQALAYRLNAGEVRLEGSPEIIYPRSIAVFAETGVSVRDYIAEWFARHPGASAEEQKMELASRRNVYFLFNRVTDEKLAMDQGIYNSLMVQLLLCQPHDPRFAPYFRLVYDNVFTRIYEARPAGEGED